MPLWYIKATWHYSCWQCFDRSVTFSANLKLFSILTIDSRGEEIFNFVIRYNMESGCAHCGTWLWYFLIRLTYFLELRKRAKIRNRYNQAPHLTQPTNWKVTNSQLDITNEGQEVIPFPIFFFCRRWQSDWSCYGLVCGMWFNIS